MQLIISPTSPYARKARIVAIEKGLEDRVEIINTNPLAPEAQQTVRNPLGKVPCLVLEDGDLLFDSPVICAYLNSLSSDPELFPQGENRWRAERAQALGDGIIDAAFNMVLESRRTDSEQSAYWMERWRGVILRGVAAAEEDLASYSGGFDIGLIAYASALGYLDFRHPEIAWRDNHADLAVWFEDISARRSMSATAHS
ncbi:MAG: glutathione S-transferase N-terminal domain-containing protein [Aquisalinus sp.]|nr:glutathione S-transferase N-terminal domain-containing protein [Aquisalinus sp.]